MMPRRFRVALAAGALLVALPGCDQIETTPASSAPPPPVLATAGTQVDGDATAFVATAATADGGILVPIPDRASSFASHQYFDDLVLPAGGSLVSELLGKDGQQVLRLEDRPGPVVGTRELRARLGDTDADAVYASYKTADGQEHRFELDAASCRTPEGCPIGTTNREAESRELVLDDCYLIETGCHGFFPRTCSYRMHCAVIYYRYDFHQEGGGVEFLTGGSDSASRKTLANVTDIGVQVACEDGLAEVTESTLSGFERLSVYRTETTVGPVSDAALVR